MTLTQIRAALTRESDTPGTINIFRFERLMKRHLGK
jgi:hypothetical protein